MGDFKDSYLIWIVAGLIALVLLIIFVAVLASKGAEKRRKELDDYEINQVGKACEAYVADCLKGIIDVFGGYLINDFCFEDRKGYSTEIDHILITQGGVFIIETKTNRGTIYGGVDDEKWLCVKKDYQDDKELRNPVIQNQRHINNLRRVFNRKPPKMFSVIIFSLADTDISNIQIENVFDVPSAIAYIRQLTAEAHYSKDFVERIKKDFDYIDKHYSISKEQHIKNVQKLHKK